MKPTSFLMLVFLFVWPASKEAAAEDVDLLLVLAIDVSSSVNYDEFALQMNGYATAFKDETVHTALSSGPNKKIAVAITQWAGLSEQKTVIGWTVLSNASDAIALAERIEYLPRTYPFGGTAISEALEHGFAEFAKAPHLALRRVIDISGDGKASVGPDPAGMRDAIIREGVTINGLPILNEIPDLDRYFLQTTVGGSGAFVEISKDYKDFARAITRKIAREIKGVWYGV